MIEQHEIYNWIGKRRNPVFDIKVRLINIILKSIHIKKKRNFWTKFPL